VQEVALHIRIEACQRHACANAATPVNAATVVAVDVLGVIGEVKNPIRHQLDWSKVEGKAQFLPQVETPGVDIHVGRNDRWWRLIGRLQSKIPYAGMGIVGQTVEY